MIEELRARRDRLKADLETGLNQRLQHLQAAADLEKQAHAQNGAIAECELWLAVAENKAKEAEKPAENAA